jgi:transcription antitermination factor NusG
VVVMKTAGKWLCVTMKASFQHGDRKAALRELEAVFGGDLEEVRSVCNESMAGSTDEYYVFVRCKEYQSHVEALSRTSAVVGVVPSYDNPHHFSTKEVEEFAGSVERKDKVRAFERGDMVVVKEGHLKGLYGVVCGKASKRQLKVAFSFYLGMFMETLSVTRLEYVANVLGKIGFTKAGADSFVPRRKLHRGPHRVVARRSGKT